VTSLAQQTFNGFLHLIVIDHGSSDGTADAAAGRTFPHGRPVGHR
jgi:glycosyltransferase involved in cell wall biosynthesis